MARKQTALDFDIKIVLEPGDPDDYCVYHVRDVIRVNDDSPEYVEALASLKPHQVIFRPYKDGVHVARIERIG